MTTDVVRSCSACSFTVPATSRHPVNALRSHERNAHEGWAELKRIKPQFLALVEACGSFDLALTFADRVITWTRPSDDTLRKWSVEAEEAEDEGKPIVNERQIARMERRLRRSEEWHTRKTLDANRKASERLATEAAETGTLAKPQLLQYVGMNVAYQTKEIAVAYGGPKLPTTQINQRFSLNVGPPPPKRKKVEVIDAEVRELGTGD